MILSGCTYELICALSNGITAYSILRNALFLKATCKEGTKIKSVAFLRPSLLAVAPSVSELANHAFQTAHSSAAGRAHREGKADRWAGAAEASRTCCGGLDSSSSLGGRRCCPRSRTTTREEKDAVVIFVVLRPAAAIEPVDLGEAPQGDPPEEDVHRLGPPRVHRAHRR